ncbi:MAG: hypothetical protein Kow0098_17320 [Ignavibacteriaceae bacterium]
MRNFFIILIIFSINIFSQEEKTQNPAVELPDFIITGKDVITIKKGEKPVAEFISTVSDEFLKPVYSPEELLIADLSNPVEKDMNLLDSSNYYTGRLKLGLGLYSLPETDLTIFHLFDNGHLNFDFNGLYQREFVDYSDRYSLEGGLALRYMTPADAGFVPFTFFEIGGNYFTRDFKFYGASDPTVKRNINGGNINFSFGNFYSEKFNFQFEAKDSLINGGEESFSENQFSLGAFTKINYNNFNIRFNAIYMNFQTEDSLVSGLKEEFIHMRPAVGLIVSDIFRASFGFTFEKTGFDRFTSPYASFGLMIEPGLSLFGEYSPESVYLTAGQIIRYNEYFDPQLFRGFYFSKKNKMNIALKYEYDSYFQIEGGVKYYSSDSYPYFSSIAGTGKFNLLSKEGKNLEAYINLIFYRGPYGEFYSTLRFADVRDSANNFIPFNPSVLASAQYGYKFENGFYPSIKLEYYSVSYADLENLISIDPFINLNLKLEYLLNEKFSLIFSANNLLNKDNVRWIGYQTRPVDFIAGISYKW